MKQVKTLLILISLFSCIVADDICVGTLVSKAKKLQTNSYCMEGFFFEIAARVAADYVNKNNEYLQGHKLVLDVRDIMKDRYETLEVTRELIKYHLADNSTCPIAAVIGADDDELNSLIQLTTEKYLIPQISFESHTTDFSNVKLYPYYIRLSASQDLIAIALLKLIEKYRWQRFNLIASDDSNGSNAIEELKKAVEYMPAEFQDYITIGASIRYPADIYLPLTEEDNEALTGNLNAILKTGNRINILFADPTQAGAFLYAASKHDMTGTGWVFIGTHWNTMQTYAGLAPEFQDTVREAMNGMVGVSPFIGNVAALNEPFTKFVNEHPELQKEAKELCGQEIVIKKELYPEYMIFVYDSVVTVAKGIEAVLNNNPNATFFDEDTRKDLYDELLNVRFEGQSGTVHFKPGIGDRLPVKLEIVNIYDGQIVDIGDAEFNSANDYRFVIDQVPRWSGGSTAVPTDRSDSKEEYTASFMALTIFWMIIAVVLSHLLEKWEIHRMPESSAVVVFGIIAGLSLRFLHTGLSESAVFDPKMFTLFLSPIIVFDSGFNMKTKGLFFKNIGTILIYAFVGTLMNALAVGFILGILFHFNFFGSLDLSMIECLIFGSLISSFNPNATLAVFSALSVDPILNIIVYGESSVNDAICIVMFNSLSKFLLTPMSFLGVFDAIGTFIVMFLGSTGIGCGVALLACLILKYNQFHSTVVETVIVFLTSYLASELTEMVHLSGATASLFCGITMNYFGLQNLSKNSQVFAQDAVKVAGFIANTLIYFQIGSNVFLNQDIGDIPWKLVITVFLVCQAVRTVVIFVITYFVNMKRTKTKLSFQSQIMIINSGLRGVIAYSLAVNFPSHNQTIVTTVTMWTVILTVFLLGCTTYDMIRLLKIPTNCVYEDVGHGGGARHKRSIMASDGSAATRFASWVERTVIPFFTKSDSKLEEPLLHDSELTPYDIPLVESPSPAKHALPSVTRVVKGQNGKTYVHSVVDVEDDVLSDEQDDYVISDDEINSELRNMSNSNLDVTRMSISSNMSMRSSHNGSFRR